MSAAPVLARDAPSASCARRFLEGTAAVALWMTLGLVLHLSAYGYLLVGIPITLAFQRYVRKAPLRAMWVRDAPPFQLRAAGVAIAIGLMIVPLVDLVNLLRSRASWGHDGWNVAALAGAWAAAYALRYFNRKLLRELLLCLATSGTIGILVSILQDVASSGTPPADWGKALVRRYVLAEIHSGGVSTGGGMVPRRVRLPSAPSRRETRSPLGNLCFSIVGYLALSGYSRASNTKPTADICHCDSVSRPHRRALLVVLAPQREFVCARQRPLLD